MISCNEVVLQIIRKPIATRLSSTMFVRYRSAPLQPGLRFRYIRCWLKRLAPNIDALCTNHKYALSQMFTDLLPGMMVTCPAMELGHTRSVRMFLPD